MPHLPVPDVTPPPPPSGTGGGSRPGMGFVPNSIKLMTRIDGLVPAVGQLMSAVRKDLDPGLAGLVAVVASTAAGCQYCQAHASVRADQADVDHEKLAAVWTFETDDQFTSAERSALRIARDAAQVPNATTQEHFDEALKYYSEVEVSSIVGIVAAFGFLNRWNDTMATPLEDAPAALATATIGGPDGHGWTAGKHT